MRYENKEFFDADWYAAIIKVARLDDRQVDAITISKDGDVLIHSVLGDVAVGNVGSVDAVKAREPAVPAT